MMKWARTTAAVFALLAVIGTAACQSEQTASSSTSDDSSGWTKSADDTTCTDWLHEMVNADRSDMARLTLDSWRKVTDDASPASGSQVSEFKGGITDFCMASDDQSWDILMVAGLLYNDQRPTYAP